MQNITTGEAQALVEAVALALGDVKWGSPKKEGLPKRPPPTLDEAFAHIGAATVPSGHRCATRRMQRWQARHDAEQTKKLARAPAAFQRYEGFSSGLTLLRLVGCTLCGLPPFTTFVDDGRVTGHGSGSLSACLVASSAAGMPCHDVHAVIEALGRAVTPEIKSAYCIG